MAGAMSHGLKGARRAQGVVVGGEAAGAGRLARHAAAPSRRNGGAATRVVTSAALEDGGMTAMTVVSGLGAVAGGAVVLQISDPEKRRTDMTMEAGGDELRSVGDYFEGEGFQRWRRIYDDEAEDVNGVQKGIRDGHAKTIDIALNWLGLGGLEGKTICDCGCGTGSLTIPMALQGAQVTASDISSMMVQEAGERYDVAAQGVASAVKPEFVALDLESVSGKYHTVTCLDVVIHYPDDKMAGMLKHLTDLAEERLILSFAPKTPFYSFLKRVGELFPGPSKATRAYLHSQEDVEKVLNQLGWTVIRNDLTKGNFYFSQIMEARRI